MPAAVIASICCSSIIVPAGTITVPLASTRSSAVERPRMREASEATTWPASMMARILMPRSVPQSRLADDGVLRDVDEAAGKVARVRRLERRVGKALAGAVRRVEVLEHVEAFLEVRDDRALDDLAGGLCHQAAHRRELLHLRRRAAGARMRHHVDRVDRPVASGIVLLHRRDAVHHLGGETIRALRPGVDNLVVFLALGDQAVLVLLLVILRQRPRLLDDRPLVLGHDHVVLAEGNAGLERVIEAERHGAVAEDHRLLLTAVAVDGVDHPRDLLLRHELVHDVEGHGRMVRQDAREDHAAGRGVVDLGDRFAVLADAPVQRYLILVWRVTTFSAKACSSSPKSENALPWPGSPSAIIER